MGIQIYLGGPLFSQAEIDWGRQIKAFLLRRIINVEVVWPYEIPSRSKKEAFHANLDALKNCDLMVAILDGPQVDDGTAWEIGHFYSQGKKILGIRTDSRRAGEFIDSAVNLMVECSCYAIAENLDCLAAELKRLQY